MPAGGVGSGGLGLAEGLFIRRCRAAHCLSSEPESLQLLSGSGLWLLPRGLLLPEAIVSGLIRLRKIASSAEVDIVEDLAEAFILEGVSLIFLIDSSSRRDDVLPTEGGLEKLSFQKTADAVPATPPAPPPRRGRPRKEVC